MANLKPYRTDTISNTGSVTVYGSNSYVSDTMSVEATSFTDSKGYVTKGMNYSFGITGGSAPKVYQANVKNTFNFYHTTSKGSSGGGCCSGGYGGTRTVIIQPKVKKEYTGGSLLEKLPKPTKTEYVKLKEEKDMFGWSLLGNWLDWLEKNKSAITKQYVL